MVRIVRLALLLSLIGAVLAPASAQTGISLDEVRQAGLRVVEITTEGGEEPRGEEIAKPGDPDNVNIVSANKVGCRIVIKGTALDASRKLYNRRWGTTYTTVRNNALSTLDWLQSHIDPLDRQIQLIDVADSGLVTAVTSGDSQNGGRPTYYNIKGVRVSSSARPAIAICRQGNAVKIVLRHEAHAGGAQ